MGGLTTRQLSRENARGRSKHSGQLQPGYLLQERYKIIGTLGVGGFSSVYQARDMRFSKVTKLCAVKEMVHMSPDPKMREVATKAFEREASILATLDHHAIVDVYDYFSEADRSYLVLEFIRGKDLESLLAERTSFFETDEVLDWALQICEVLVYLHNHKPDPIVFRDLKPSNIMLDPHGQIRLIDFGIAKVFQSEEKNTTIGTEGYAPPEQYRGEASPAGDVYGLGATIHHLLTRQDPRLEPPFSFHERPVQAVNPEVPAALEKVVMRCVAYNADDRYPDGNHLQKALLELAKRPAGEAGKGQPGFTLPETRQQNGSPQAGTERQGTPSVVGRSEVQPVWSFKCEDEIRATPAIGNNNVYIGVYDNNLYALDARNGQFRWKFPAKDSIAGSPFVYKNAILVGSADRNLYCLHSFSGRITWRFMANGPIYSSPRVRFDHVIVGCDDHHVYAINVNNGRAAWQTDGLSPIRSSPFITDDYIFIGSEGGSVFCLNLAGEIKWQFQARGAVTSTPAVTEEMVIVGSMDNTVYALDITSGWPIWRVRTNRAVISSPAVHDGVAYIGSADGSLYAIETNSGRKLWDFATSGQVASSPAVWNGGVYFGSTDGNVYCVDINRGKLRWRFGTGGMVISSPAIANGLLYVGSTDQFLYALPV